MCLCEAEHSQIWVKYEITLTLYFNLQEVAGVLGLPSQRNSDGITKKSMTVRDFPVFFFNVLALSEAVTSIHPATAVFNYTICLHTVDTYTSTKWGLFFFFKCYR